LHFDADWLASIFDVKAVSGAYGMVEWALITNHTAVLLHIARTPRITAREIADGTGISERAIRKIIADLNRDHYISKKREGRHVLYTIYTDNRMPDFSVPEITVGHLLEALGWQGIKDEERVSVLVGAGSKPLVHFYRTAEQEQKSIDDIYSQLF
jgi:DNA-binding transcriptional ArsR family regulator